MVAPFSMHAVKMSILLVVMANRSDVLEQKKNIRKFECHLNQDWLNRFSPKIT